MGREGKAATLAGTPTARLSIEGSQVRDMGVAHPCPPASPDELRIACACAGSSFAAAALLSKAIRSLSNGSAGDGSVTETFHLSTILSIEK